MNAEDNSFFPELIKIPLEDWIDLHTFAPGEIADLLEEYIRACAKEGFPRVRIIHGKGTGALRKRVHECLHNNPLVERLYQAPPGAGGWGATIVVLRKPPG
jgi:dsDNA-specific endonuclease/ATPase MutS2